MQDVRVADIKSRQDTGLSLMPEGLEALGTEALLRAYVPGWAAKLKAGDFGGADAALAQMRQLGTHNADARPLVAELEWIGRLERYAAQRGADAPIRLYADEAPIRQLLAHWNQDTIAHQLARPDHINPRTIWIEHPTGMVDVLLSTKGTGPDMEVVAGTLRTARPIMKGEVMVPASLLRG